LLAGLSALCAFSRRISRGMAAGRAGRRELGKEKWKADLPEGVPKGDLGNEKPFFNSLPP
jgi:hypothetical protein